MHISLVKKSTTPHTISIVDATSMKKLSPAAQQYVHNALKLKKNDQYKIGLLPSVDKTSVCYCIYIYIADMKKFSSIMEDVVADIGACIKKTQQEFFLDMDNILLPHDEKELFQQLLAVNLYTFMKYKHDKKVKYHLAIKNSKTNEEKFTSLVESFKITKNLVNDPANSAHPKAVEEEIKQLFGKHKHVSINVIKGKELQKKGLNGIYEVGKGSEHEPRLVIIEYKGGKGKGYEYGLVGKGVCFDTGGYNLKPTGSMEDMKLDMAGAATLLGVLHYVVETKLQKNIVIAIPLVENMVSHNAYKPGDVIRMYNGKTVEVGNTDAEGRLILGDTVSYVEKKYNPGTVFDFATLTGAQIVALGNRFTAIIGRNSVLNKKIQDLSIQLKDRVWELPFYEPYFKTYKSDIADMNNMSTQGRMGPGVITGGLFISQFIENKNWIHFDIAGPAYIAGDALTGGGATGCMIRLVIKVLEGK